MKNKLTIAGIVLILILGLKVMSSGVIEKGEVILAGKTFAVEIAKTNATREKGLSGHKPLLANEGMLFVFEKEGNHSFWMKDMLFPIDIIWIDKNFQITHMEKSVSPESYPSILQSPLPSLYVLEVSAGVSEKLNLKTGDTVKFFKK